jgi:hypothetical protein
MKFFLIVLALVSISQAGSGPDCSGYEGGSGFNPSIDESEFEKTCRQRQNRVNMMKGGLIGVTTGKCEYSFWWKDKCE